jgi:hypothetical protein
MAPNGVSFRPVFSVTNDLNFGLLPQKELYLFSEGTFWTQHSSPNVTQGSVGFSKRELDSDLGLAWNYFDLLELRGSAYALNNLNRGISPNNASGGKEGIKLENRYYLNAANPYDVGPLEFCQPWIHPYRESGGRQWRKFSTRAVRPHVSGRRPPDLMGFVLPLHRSTDHRSKRRYTPADRY